MPGRKSTGPPNLVPKPKKLKAKRSLNALAIAEAQTPIKTKIRQNRLGESELIAKKRRREDEGESSEDENENIPSKRRKESKRNERNEEIEVESDSSGNEWTVGAVDRENDSELDSDEAFGESDEERFEGFTFRGSSSAKAPNRTTRATGVTLKRSENGDDEEFDLREKSSYEDGSSEELGDDALDLAQALDEDPSDETDDGSEGEAGSTFSQDEVSAISVSEDEDDPTDPNKLGSLQAFVSSMNPSGYGKHQDKESADLPSDGAMARRKISVADLLPSVTDPQLRKSLKMMAENDTKTASKRTGIARKLDVPLPQRQQDRLNRSAAYEKSKETLARWIETVKYNRRAEHLSFPLQNQTAAVAGNLNSNSQAKAVTKLEETIQSILQDNGLAPSNGKTGEEAIGAFEELKANEIPLSEIQARRADLRRQRELLFREEIRAKRIKKIKSKTYRKVHRKEREKILQAEQDARAAAGVEESESERERAHRHRAEERMGAKHRESRWAKGVKDSGRMKWDQDARADFTEMARRGDELTRRIEGKEIVNSDIDSGMSGSDEEAQVSDEDDNLARLPSKLRGSEFGDGPINPLADMAFMKRAEASRKSRNEADIKSFELDLLGQEQSDEGGENEQGAGRRSYGPFKPGAKQIATTSTSKPKRGEFEERDHSESDEVEMQGSEDEDMEIVVNQSQHRANESRTPKRKDHISKAIHHTGKEPDDLIAENPWLSAPKSSLKNKRNRTTATSSILISNSITSKDTTPTNSKSRPSPNSTLSDLKKPINPHAKNGADNDDNISENDTETGPLMSKNQALIHRAFAGDSVVASFSAEKRATIASEAISPQTTSTLPGWGSWTGAGLSRRDQKQAKWSKSQQQQQRHSNHKNPDPNEVNGGIDPTTRQDHHLSNVIIPQKRIKKNAKYLASQLPHPFETRAQYERSLRLPVGPEWSTKETFQGMTKPRVVVRTGEIVRPLKRPMV